MANTYSNIMLHLIFAVKHRDGKISIQFRDRLFQYIGGILRNIGQTPIAIGGIDDHVHIFFSYNMKMLIPDIVREIKSNSSLFINKTIVLPQKFEWQRGYGVFSHSNKEKDAITKYVSAQCEHHKNMTLNQEMTLMLERSNISFNPKYLFEEV